MGRRWVRGRLSVARPRAATSGTLAQSGRRHGAAPEATREAERIWDEINGLNLRENIAPTRERSDLILEKAEDHRAKRVRLRRR